ncbi:MAG: hypothetical protein XE11_1259 [Methanomicrobiales archaeon 53_19]|jgi:hypothetical protein|uniref:hypothetical protein n=1 Tax=Methanocalculus sp. TaxID=2004547 RepID=UPI00074B23DA|nr:hypothetical protein [Methanocalculus sp.]KUK69963.1 MAG: hypothetical protein XD88_0950 [Methanocalculus sp. 52_23]KUL03453.1 MAG: hypothetical protein XE11_1259 [Methanomicrobiales archaeon 53_19]HIJ07722.1 hypothetical protein [Methanocalculus sp.]
MTIRYRRAPAFIALILAAIFTAGCPLAGTPLNDIPPHIRAANDALEELSIIEGRTNTFTLDDEIYEIDLLFASMEELPEDDEKLMERYTSYRIWTDALRSGSKVVNDDYSRYTVHLKRAEQFYDAFNYVDWKSELNEAKTAIEGMEHTTLSAAYSLDTIPEGVLSAKEQTELLRTRAALLNIHSELPMMKSELDQLQIGER